MPTEKDGLAPPEARNWTRAEHYIGAFAHRRSARRARAAKPRTQPESPRLLLSTAPFLILTIALGVLSAAVMVAAWTVLRRPAEAPRQQQAEPGTAARGWFQDAEREFAS
jgi:hypothetical protein